MVVVVIIRLQSLIITIIKIIRLHHLLRLILITTIKLLPHLLHHHPRRLALHPSIRSKSKS